MRRLQTENCDVVTVPHERLDLCDGEAVREWLEQTRPEIVFVAAAKVGGILANDSHPAVFLRDNMAIELNLIHESYRVGVEKLLFLGSSCIYPRLSPQPIPEEALMSGPLEPTNQWYAIAKIAGIRLCQAYRRQYGCNFISAMPTNLYGPGDNFDLLSSHVAPALMRKAHEAKESGQPSLQVWGSGQPMREFMYADDCADALVHLMKHYSHDLHVNIGTGSDISISDLATTICDIVDYRGRIEFDTSKPDGMPRKRLDVSRLHDLGWHHTTPFEEGLQKTYAWYLDNVVAHSPMAANG
ncbi:MAG: GDP-L-fucose synthase [Rhodospirillales bacterium]